MTAPSLLASRASRSASTLVLPWLWAATALAPTAVLAQPAAAPAPQSAARAHRVLAPDDLKALAWRSVGPANMGGRVADIAIAPGNSKVFFVGYGTGGLFRTTNAGTTFEPVFDREATASIGSVVVADAPPDWPGWKDEPVEAKPASARAKAGAKAPAKSPTEQRTEQGKAKIVWVGTGEGNGRNSSSWGNGVYRSTDGGSSFEHLGLDESHDIPRLAVDPRDPDVCYVAALGHLWGPNPERGLYKTSDGGRTWKAVLQLDEHTGACDVILDPAHPEVVYAAMYARRRTAYSFQSGGPEGGIYRSRDAGRTWQKLTRGLPPQTGRIGLDVYRKNPRILYALIESDFGGIGVDTWDDRSRSGGVFRSEDGGDTWTRMNERMNRPFYFSKIRVDPSNDQRVYLPAYRLYVSDDGGRTLRSGGARRPHVDQHAFVIDPADPQHLLMGTDGGIYVSWDAGATWDYLNHLATGEFYNLALNDSDPYLIGGGLQDNGSWVGPSATIWEIPGDTGKPLGGITNDDWRYIFDGDGYHFAFDPTDSNVVYAEWQGGGIHRIHLDTGRQKGIYPAPKEGQPRFRFNWNTPFFVSPHVKRGEPTTLYLGGNYVFKLLDGGRRWERISDDLSTRDVNKITTVGSEAETHGTVVSLAESPLARGMLWAGTDDGRVHVTRNDGKSWTDVTPPAVNGLYVSRIEASHHQREVAYVSVDGHRSDDMKPYLYRTGDGGKTWTSIAGDLPAGGPVKVVREDRSNPAVLYVGTERAAFVSVNGGARWVKLNGTSLPTVAVDDLQQHAREMDLVAGTHGRSIYVLDDASPLSQLAQAVMDSALHLFDLPPARPRFFMPVEGVWGDRMFVASNPAMGARITYWLRDHTDEKVSVAIEDERGRVIRKLTGTGRAGLNRVLWDLMPEEHEQLPNPESFLGQKEFVPPGVYGVTVSFAKHKMRKSVTVLPPPGAEPAKPARKPRAG
jgi:photosystem II stability/assembly factor-like uncharacterized protein